MTGLHTFDVTTSTSLQALKALITGRWSQGDEGAVVAQRDFERQVLEAVHKLGAEVLEADLSRLDVRAPGILVDGEPYRPKMIAKGRYTTLLGTVEVERQVYESRGGHGEKRCVPLEMRLGMIDGHWTPAAAELGCRFMAATSSREAEALLEAGSALRSSSCHLDRLSKHFNALWEPCRLELMTELHALEQLPSEDEVSLILVSLDGVMLPMKDAPREPGSEGGQGPTGYREASSATFCLFDKADKRLHTLRLGRMPESKKTSLKELMKQELKRLESHYRTARFVAVADGAKENWRILAELNDELSLELVTVLDFYHAMEHVATALTACSSVSVQAREQTLAEWRRALLEDEDGVDQVIAGLRTHGKGLRGKRRKDVAREVRYLERHRDMMRYAQRRREGCPIGSGVQEAACKTLVSQRMKRSGMSWLPEGGQAILTLRSLEQSGRMGSAWEVLRTRLRRDIPIDPAPARKRPAPRVQSQA